MEDERLVRLAQDHGHVTADQVARAREEQRQLADRGVERSVWFLLQDLGFISDDQVRDLRKYVSSSHVRALEVGGYTLQGRLGSGGMGDVFRAVNPGGEAGAVKLLSSKLVKSVEHTRRFHREARATLRLKHPHITRSLSSGEIDGQCYLIMELVDGPSLKAWLVERGRMPGADALLLLWQMAQALRYAWHRGVLHRDVKPANIMLGKPRPGVAEPFCAKLCDFGLAKVWSDGESEPDVSRGGLTGTGMALGTPHYMAPEQASGERDLDQRADIYSMGASLYHALLGQTMYSGRSSTVIMYKQVTEDADLEPLRKQGTDPRLVKLISRMLDRRRDRRLASWEAVLAAVVEQAPDMARLQQETLDQLLASATSSTLAPGILPVGDEHSGPALTPRVATRRPPPVPMALVVVVATALVLCAAVAVLLIADGGHGNLRVTPSTLAAALADAHARVLELEPGDYRGTWRLGVAQTGMTMRGAAPGVRLLGSGDQPALRLEPGLRNARLANLDLSHPQGIALEALTGTELTIEDCRLDGQLVVAGGVLTGRRLELRRGAEMDSQGALTLEDSVLHGTQVLLLRSGALALQRCRLGGGGPEQTLIAAQAGSVVLDAVDCIAENGTGTGLALGASVLARLTDVTLSGAATGIAAEGALLTFIDGLTIEARSTGIQWSGARDPSWRWSGMAITAPVPVAGPIALVPGTGARRERLVPPRTPVTTAP